MTGGGVSVSEADSAVGEGAVDRSAVGESAVDASALNASAVNASAVEAGADTSDAELDEVLTAASSAAPALAASTTAERARWLEAIADALDAVAVDLVPIAIDETSLAEARLRGELHRTTFQLRLFAGVVREGSYLAATIDHADADWGMGPRPDLRRMMRPLGPAAVFAASNFPFAFSVAGGDTASALAAGCPVVLKSHPGHPALSVATAHVLLAALSDAGAPSGTFAAVAGVEGGRALITDPRIRVASFTGSLRGGLALGALAASRADPIPFFGELGSVNPVFVTPGAASARAEAIVAGFIGSLTLGAGQFCTNPGVLFVPVDSDLSERIVAALAEVPAAPMLNRAISDGFHAALARLGSRPGVRTLLRSDAAAQSRPAPALFSTTLEALLDDTAALTEECFGPAGLIVTYDRDDDLARAARAFTGELTATIHGEPDEAIVAPLLDLLAERAGRVLWNGWPTGVSVTHGMQHGGPFPASTSVQHTSVGSAAIDRFVRPVSFQDTPTSLLPPALRDDNPWHIPQRVDGRLTVSTR